MGGEEEQRVKYLERERERERRWAETSQRVTGRNLEKRGNKSEQWGEVSSSFTLSFYSSFFILTRLYKKTEEEERKRWADAEGRSSFQDFKNLEEVDETQVEPNGVLLHCDQFHPPAWRTAEEHQRCVQGTNRSQRTKKHGKGPKLNWGAFILKTFCRWWGAQVWLSLVLIDVNPV